MKRISITAVALGLTILVTNGYTAYATTSSTAKQATQINTTSVIHTLANLKPIKITSKSTVRLTDVNILPLDEESILTYTLTIQNLDSKTLDLLDYWSKVKSYSGTTYSTSLMTMDKDKKKLSAGSSTTLTYVAKVGKNTKISDLIIQVIKWDFSQTGYESLKGQFKIPAAYVTSTPANQSKTIKTFDTPIKATINQAATLSNGDYNYISVALNLENIGYKVFEDPKVKFVIKASNGASYPMSADSTSTEYRIQPQDSKTINLMAEIPKTIKLEKMELVWVQDDETSKLSLPIATMQLPSNIKKSSSIQPNTEQIISIASSKIAVSVKSASIMQSFDEHNLITTLNLRNTSGKTLTIPNYEFEIQTSDGYRLPFNTQINKNITLKPLEERVLNLSATIPANINPENPLLIMNLPASPDTKEEFKYPVAIFSLPKIEAIQNMIGQKQFVQTTNGILGFTLESIQRLPWSDGDIVSAKINIYNSGYKTIMLPEMAGLIKLDSALLTSDSKLINTQSVGIIGPNMSTDVYVISKIPSYLKFSQLQISLLEKIGDNSSEWVQFANAGDLPAIPLIGMGESYKIETAGRNTEIKVLRSHVYTGPTSDLIYTELETKNMEDHQIDLSQFTGSYQGSKGQTYRASVSQINTSVGPEEKSIVALWAKIPKSLDTNGMKLIVGEGITENKLTPIKGEVNGYVNATALDLAIAPINARGNLSGLDLFPYTLTVKNVRANLSGSTSVNLTFEYSQTKNTEYSIGEFTHKYLFEVVDSSGRIFEKEFHPETDLKITNNGTMSFSFDDPIFDKKLGGNFQLIVYDLFEGQKMKLGSQNYIYISPTIIQD